jgi:SAM-dependent methyltransferase
MRDDFAATQRAHFERADAAHFAWQTRGAGFADREAKLLRGIVGKPRPPFLEVGCGEGGNLFHLLAAAPLDDGAHTSPLHVGADAALDKVRFAATEVRQARFACADSGSLPFRDASFATVLIRDVLHHLGDPGPTLAEAVRVLAPGGTLLLVEPNAHNPLVRLQMAIVPAERGARRSDRDWIERLLARLPLADLTIEMAVPLPVARVVLHHRFGLPRLGANRAATSLISGCESLAQRVMPRSRWSYVVARAMRAAS